MSEFGSKADVQQIRVIALVVINVLPEPARNGHSHRLCLLLN